MNDLHAWEKKYDALPPWAKKLVRGVDGLASWGIDNGDKGPLENTRDMAHFHASFHGPEFDTWRSGFDDLRTFAVHLAAERKARCGAAELK
mgnify:FL=1